MAEKSQPATKSDIDQLAEMLQGTTRVMKSRFDKVEDRLADMGESLHRIEHEILKDHARRIEALEEKVAS